MLRLVDINFAFAKTDNQNQESSYNLKNINLKIKTGEIAAIIGESGCGKSTLLNLTYGLLQQQSGKVYWYDEELLGPDYHLIPGHSMMKYVPQEFDLMPFTTVAENIGEHLSIQNDDRVNRIDELLETVDLMSFKNTVVKNLSGGQKQRVALAKALAQEPQLLLLDEPFSHIDNFRKNELRRRLFAYLKNNRIACMIATHDKNDVLSFTNRTVVMKDGHIEIQGDTHNIYNYPNTFYTASLFEEVNVIPPGYLNNNIELLVYPHRIEIVGNEGVKVQVVQTFFEGSTYLVKALLKDIYVYFYHDSDISIDIFVSIRIIK